MKNTINKTKSKLRRFSRSSLAVCLALLIMLGSITTFFAVVIEDASVGADSDLAYTGDTTYYLLYRTDNSKSLDGMSTVAMSDNGNGTYTASFTSSTLNFVLGVNDSNSTSATLITSSTSVAKEGDIDWVKLEDNSQTYYVIGYENTATIYVTYNPTSDSVTVSTAESGTSGSEEGGDDDDSYVTTHYYVTGSFTDPTWTVTSTAYPLYPNSDGSLYTTEIAITEADTLEFKITDATDYVAPTNNYSITALKAGTLVITFDGTDVNAYMKYVSSGNLYYYRGTANSWGATKFTSVGSDGNYEYYSVTNTNPNSFKISESADSWEYDSGNIDSDFNGANVACSDDSGNCKCEQSGTYYILVYYPNTVINDTSSPIICASTTLPNDSNTTYPITTSAANGTVEVSPSSAYTGQTVTATFTPDTGYEFTSAVVKNLYGDTVENLSVSSNSATYTCPAYANVVEATFSPIDYTISYEGSNYSYGESPETANYEDEISISLTADDGYGITSVTSSAGDLSTQIADGGATATCSFASYPNSNVTITVTAPARLTAPVISLSDSNVTASKDEKVTLSWDAVTGAGSYIVYKDGTLVDTVYSTSYEIERGYSYSGSYTVVAVPSDDTAYASSVASDEAELTVSKVTLNAPNVTTDKDQIFLSDTVTFTLADTNTDYPSAAYAYYRTAAGGSDYSTEVEDLTFTNGTGDTASSGTVTYSFKATVQEAYADYYSSSTGASASVTVKDAQKLKVAGSFTSAWSYAGGEDFNGYEKPGVYTYTTDILESDQMFKFYSSSTGYSYSATENTTVVLGTEYTNTVTDSYSMALPDSGVYVIHYDIVNSKFWVTQDVWGVKAAPYYKSFDLLTNDYNDAASGTTGGTVSSTYTTVTKESAVTVTATAADGYYFDGWYSGTSSGPDFESDKLSSDAEYTFTPSANTYIYPLFVENMPTKSSVVVKSASNGTVTATYNGSSAASGSNLTNVPAGATVTLSNTPSSGYKISDSGYVVYDPVAGGNVTVTSSTFVMPSNYVEVSATFEEDLGDEDTAHDLFYYIPATASETDQQKYTNLKDTGLTTYYNSTDGHYKTKLTNSFLAEGKNTYLSYVNDADNTDLFYADDEFDYTISGTGSNYINAGTSTYSGNTVCFVQPKAGYKNIIEYILVEAYYSDNKGHYIFTVVLDEDSDQITYYAKDGVMRNAEYWSFAIYADTAVTDDDYVDISSTVTQYTNAAYITGNATKGQPITVTTTIDDDHKGDYYVAGFSFNGITPQLLSENDEGVYTCTYTIPEDFDGYVLEITPIIFLKAKHKDYYTMFNIAGYDNIKDEGWGNTLYIFPYYGEDNSGLIANYGTYPGQPVINYGGQLYTQIPSFDEITEGNEVAGLTINNGYWDFVHRTVEGWAESNDNHHQTYDYDDFYKIYKEYGNELNSVWFTFKYETDEQHRVDVPDNESGDNDTYYYKDGIASTLTQEELNDYSEANGFEYYINPNGKKIDLFGEVLTGAELSADPIYVISQGYEYNDAGKFGTEWDVFVYNSTTEVYDKITATNRTSIIPSALHVSSDNLSTYDLDEYSDLYTALQSYKDRPVMVSYEKDISGGYFSGGNNIAYRCDGVWSYTLKTDYISATTSIEYSDDNGATWTEDSYSDSSAVGSVTNCKAYFTYVDSDTNGYASSYNGATSISNALIDESKYFTFQAEAAGKYVFAGWIRRDAAGNESDIGYDSEYVGSSKMSSSAEFVARFKKVTSGNLAISHTLDSGSTGLGTTYLGVYVGTYAESIFTPTVTVADESTNTSAKTISSTYITSSSENYIQVVIKTVASGENTFNKFQLSIDGDDNVDSDATYLPSGESSTSDSTTTQTIIFPISSLFTGTTQNLTSLGYYSLLNETLNEYEVTFNYQDRNGTSKSMLRKGTFTSNQLKNYVSGTGTSKTVETEFYNELVPSVSNFKSDITWDLSGASGSWTSSTVDGAIVYTFTATVGSSLTDTLTRTVTFVTPFAMTDYVASDSTYVSSPYTQDILSVTYGTLVKVNNGSYDVDNGNFVTAPSTLTDGDTTYYFHRWHITTIDGDDVASCYYPEYNYITYDNYIITAEYSTDTTKYYEYYKTESSVTVTFLKNTRTQWNTGTETSPTTADLIYSDFALSFKYKDVELATADLTTDNSGYRAGVIMQRLDAVELDSDGDHSMTAAQYASEYGSTYSGLDSSVQGYLETYAKTGSASGSGMTLRRTQFTNGHFDNKNRLEYYVGMYNSKSWNETDQKWDYTEWDSTTEDWTSSTYTNSKYVYRLFTYVYDVEADTVIISDPSYFFLYDTVNS